MQVLGPNSCGDENLLKVLHQQIQSLADCILLYYLLKKFAYK